MLRLVKVGIKSVGVCGVTVTGASRDGHLCCWGHLWTYWLNIQRNWLQKLSYFLCNATVQKADFSEDNYGRCLTGGHFPLIRLWIWGLNPGLGVQSVHNVTRNQSAVVGVKKTTCKSEEQRLYLQASWNPFIFLSLEGRWVVFGVHWDTQGYTRNPENAPWKLLA